MVKVTHEKAIHFSVITGLLETFNVNFNSLTFVLLFNKKREVQKTVQKTPFYLASDPPSVRRLYSRFHCHFV